MPVIIPGQNVETGSSTSLSVSQLIASSNNSPLQIPNLATLPGSAGVTGSLVIVEGQWYISDGSSWTAMVASGTNALNPATTTTLGGVKIGSGVNVQADGTISVTPSSVGAIATTQLGVSSGVATLDSSTKLTISQLPTATTSALGGVQISTSPSSGNPVAVTTSDILYTNIHGGTYLATSGNGLSVSSATDSQTISLSEATTSALGGVIIGSGIDVNSGTISATASSVGALPITGGTLTGALILNADPTTPLGAATKQYVDATASGLQPKDSVRVATTGANINLSGLQTIDGVALNSGDRVLVKDQTTEANNGIYIAASGSWTRASDANSSTNVKAGMFVFVDMGTKNAGTGWVLVIDPDTTITVGTTNLPFTQFSGAGDIQVDTGLSKSGNTLSLSDATTTTLGGVIVGSGINVNSGTISVTPTSIGTVTETSNVSDVELTSTTSTNILSFTPNANGNFIAYVYFRVVTAATTVTITLNYTDGSGSQSIELVSGSQNVGSYHIMPLMFNATTSTVTLTAQAGTANQVYVSATVLGA